MEAELEAIRRSVKRVIPCYGTTSQESFEKMVKDFGQWNVTWMIDDGGKGRRRTDF